jgi:NAD(P)-dependent dehydrogenase (short-subunit alcohol dehydrogenase family)
VSKVLVITGGGRGIGAATACLAAQRGYAVCVNYLRDRDAAEKLKKELEKGGSRAIAVAGDVASEGDVMRLFETVDRALGRVTALVNNAGIVDRAMPVADMSAGHIARMLAINVTGSFLCTREAVKRMSTRRGGGGGAIVNVSSIAARLGGAGVPASSAPKSISPAEIRGGWSASGQPRRWGVRASPKKWRAQSSGCCPTRPRT